MADDKYLIISYVTVIFTVVMFAAYAMARYWFYQHRNAKAAASTVDTFVTARGTQVRAAQSSDEAPLTRGCSEAGWGPIGGRLHSHADMLSCVPAPAHRTNGVSCTGKQIWRWSEGFEALWERTGTRQRPLGASTSDPCFPRARSFFASAVGAWCIVSPSQFAIYTGILGALAVIMHCHSLHSMRSLRRHRC